MITALVMVSPLDCSGSHPAPGSGPKAARPTVVPAPNACVSNVPGPRALRRLTAEQYDSTLRDLFHDRAVPTASIFDDPIVLGFSSDASELVVKDLTSQQLMSHAETVASWAVANHLSDLSSCTGMDADCSRQFIASFGRRAFRAPLTETQVSRYQALFAGEGSFSDGVEAVVSAMLQSPSFLYRRELGIPEPARPSWYALGPHEVATALSYLLVGSMPDDALLAAADAGRLATRAEMDQQVVRLLEDPRSKDAVVRFVSGWLGVSRLDTTVKDDTVFELTDSLRQSMKAETAALIADTVFVRNGTFGNLLTAPYSFLNRELALHYGVPAAELGAELVPVYFAPDQRDRGILAHASILTGFATASTSSPVQRGKLVRTRLLCQALPPPPADLDTNLQPPQSAQTTRQHYEQHSNNAVCASCHFLMDPIGYGFEHYDGFGRWRDQEQGVPIDATGVVNAVAEGDVAFRGLGELARYLATSREVENCMVRHWSYYAYGRASWREDGCTYDAIRQEAAHDGFTMKSVLLAIVHASHFVRRVEEP